MSRERKTVTNRGNICEIKLCYKHDILFICPPLIKPFCVDSHRNICFVKTSCIKSLSIHRPYHIMNSFSKPYVLDPSGTAGPQLNARNEPVVPLVEPRVAPMLDERGSRPTIVAQIPPPLGRQARPQQGTLPLPQVCPDLLADKKQQLVFQESQTFCPQKQRSAPVRSQSMGMADTGRFYMKGMNGMTGPPPRF